MAVRRVRQNRGRCNVQATLARPESKPGDKSKILSTLPLEDYIHTNRHLKCWIVVYAKGGERERKKSATKIVLKKLIERALGRTPTNFVCLQG